MSDLKKLRELAEKATPGPWKCAGGIYVYSRDTMIADNNDETALVRARGVGGGMSREQQEANVEFVSAANPETVIALLDRIEKLEKVFNFVKDAQCECSISERQSGHLVGCWKPEFDQLSKEVSHE